MEDNKDIKTEEDPIEPSDLTDEIEIRTIPLKASNDADKYDAKQDQIERQTYNDTNEAKVTEDILENLEENKTETIMSSQPLKSSNPSITIQNDQVIATSLSTSLGNVKEKHVDRKRSDILPSLRELPRDQDPSLMIFCSKGQPTKKCVRRRDVNSTVLPFGFNEKRDQVGLTSPRIKVKTELTPKISQIAPEKTKLGEDTEKIPFSDKNPNIPIPNVSRNVLTGFGVSSRHEFKSKSIRRKDGNPLLGEGYEEPAVTSNVGRVPPGGFSSGLW